MNRQQADLPFASVAGEPQTRFSDSLADVISTRLTPSLERLIPPEITQRLAILTRHLPSVITSLWGYELPVSRQEVFSDFLVCLHQAALCSEAFQATVGLEKVIAEPYYNRFQDLVTRWADPGDRVGRVISNIWLEYDYDGLTEEPLVPNFFFGPKAPFHLLEVVLAARQIFDLLSPEGMPKGTYPFLIRCMSLLRPEGRVTQIGQMLARHENRLRLFIQHLPAHAILPYLRKLDYPHADNPLVADQIDHCYQLADRVELDIDIADRIGDQIGLECYFDTTEKALTFLADLVRRGLCVPQKYQYLRDHLLQLRHTPHDPLVPFFSHVKLGFHPKKGFATKVYMGYVDEAIAPSVIQTQPIHTP